MGSTVRSLRSTSSMNTPTKSDLETTPVNHGTLSAPSSSSPTSELDRLSTSDPSPLTALETRTSSLSLTTLTYALSSTDPRPPVPSLRLPTTPTPTEPTFPAPTCLTPSLSPKSPPNSPPWPSPLSEISSTEPTLSPETLSESTSRLPTLT